MTDISPWPRLLHPATVRDVRNNPLTDPPLADGLGRPQENWDPSGYKMVPLNDYQVANLLAFFDGVQRQQFADPTRLSDMNVNTGDWWFEVQSVCMEYVALFTAPGRDHHKNIRSNNGWQFYYDPEKRATFAYTHAWDTITRSWQTMNEHQL
jgi:hypothetical protein